MLDEPVLCGPARNTIRCPLFILLRFALVAVELLRYVLLVVELFMYAFVAIGFLRYTPE